MARRKNIPETKEHILHIDAKGRIAIPILLRKALGLEPGAVVVGRIEKDKLVFTKREPIEELRAIFKNAKFSTKDFISERREEAKKEN